jgi:murein L,D-transpeptidase YafK
VNGGRLSLRVIVLVVTASLLSGCAGLLLDRPLTPPRARVQPPAVEPPGERFLAWASSEPLLIVVDKAASELSLYEYGRELRSYPAVFGRKPGRKLFEGDRRTPSGFYRVTRKRAHWRFHRFFDLDYPTPEDMQNFRAAKSAGIVPAALPDGTRPGAGGAIGIHGTDDENLNRLNVNWTLGCVSVLNEHMDELQGLVPLGTPVLIRDGESPFRVRLVPPGSEDDAEPRRARTGPDAPPEASALPSPSEPPEPQHAAAEQSGRPRPR